MRHIYAKRLFLLASILLISNVLFSNTFENKIKNNSPIKVNSITTNLVNEHFETVKVVTGPLISNQPQNTIKCAGTTATFTVDASGTGTLTYSWKKNGTALTDGGTISGATTSSLNIANVITTDADDYTCEVTDSTGTTTSNVATLTVNALPTLTKNGPSAICLGASATLSVSGANSYLWNTLSTLNSITVSPTTTTTYTVEGTNSNGCTKTETFTVQVNALPILTITGNSTICNGTSTTLTATGATSYNWGGSLTTSSIVVNPTSNSNYTVTGTDNNGCVNSASQQVTVKAIPNASVNATTPICAGNIATFTITGTPNATVSYNIGAGSNTSITLNNSGLATVNIPGATLSQTLNLVSVSLLGCQSTTFSTASATVVVNTIPAAPGTSVINYCQNQTASTLTATGSNLKWYALSSGGAAETTAPTPNTAIVGTSTPYYVSQTSVNGCESLRTPITVIVNALPTVNAGSDQTICSGSSVTLSGTGAISYIWSNGSSNNSTISPTSTTTYTVTGTDANTCTNTDQVTISVNAIPAVPVVTNSTVTYCQNQPAIALNATGVSLKWYTLSSGGTGSSIAPTPTTAATGTTSHYVSQTVDGCESARTQIDVTINALPALSIAGTSPICANSNTTLTASGGNGTYAWSNGLGSSNVITINPSNTTTYSVTGYAANGCTGTASFTVNVNSRPTISGGGNRTICAGNSVTLSGSGGTGSYTWSNSVLNGDVITPLSTTTYTVTGQGSNGCTNTATVLVTVNNNPATPTLNVTQPNCTTNTGSIQFTGLPNTGNWTLNPGSINGTGSNYTLNNLAPATYNFIIRDANLCTSTPISQTINAAPASTPAPTAVAQTFMSSTNPTVGNLQITSLGTPVWYSNANLGSTALLSNTPITSGTYYAAQIENGCESAARTSVLVTVNANSVGGSVSGGGLVCYGTNSTTLTLSGHTGAITKWQSASDINFTTNVNDITNTSTTYTATNLITPLFYRAVVQSGSSTSNSSTTLIDIIPQSIGGTITSASAAVCSGQPSGLLTLNGNVGSVIRWESSTNGSSWNAISNTNTTYISGPLTQTSYFRAIVQNSGCAIVPSNNFIININTAPTITGTLSACIGNTSTLTGSATPAANPWNSSNPGIATVTATGLVTAISPGTTTITYTNSNNCSASVSFVVHTSPVLFITNPTAVCNPNTVNLTAANITSGSTPGLSYSYFTNLSPLVSLSNPSIVATSGSYYIKGTDSNGCSTTVNQINVVVNPLPTYTISGNNSICAGQSTTLTASSATTYLWNNSLGNTNSITVTPTADTTYSVTSTDNNGCAGTASYAVQVKPLPNINAGLDRNICIGSSVTLSGTGAGPSGTYSWNNGVTNGVMFNPLSTTTYTVTGTDNNGCSKTDNVTITVNNNPSVPTITVTQPSCASAIATVEFSGLPASGSWTINPGAYNGSGPSFTLSNQPAGNYNFTVTDNNSCTSAVNSKTINAVPTIPTTPIVGTPTQPNCSNANGSVTLSGLPTGSWTITKLPGGQTYSASGNTTPYNINDLTPGSYTFTVSNGTCSSSATTTVTIDPIPSQNAPNLGPIVQTTCTLATGGVTLNNLPAGTYTLTRFPDGFSSTGSGTTKLISGLVPGTYTYTVTNAAGCTSVNSNSIVIDAQTATPLAPQANSQSFLASSNPTVSNLAIIGAGIATAKWYSSPTAITPLNNTTLLTTGTYYASQTVNGCESNNRTAVSVTLFPDSTGGSVNNGLTIPVCFGTNSTVLNLTGQTGTVIKWQSASDAAFSSNLVDISNTSTSYTVTNLTTTLYFRAVVQSGTAPVEFSIPAKIEVNAASVGGTLSTSTSICRGENSGLLTVSGFTGTIIRWEQSTDGGTNWTPIANTTNIYTSGPLTTTTQYRVLVKNGVCSEAPSSVATITIKATPIITDIPNQSVCIGTTKTFGEPFIANHSYTWTSDLGNILPQQSQVNILFNQVVTQNYTYTITNDISGCSVQDQFQVVVNPLPNPVVISDTSICVGNSIAIGSPSVMGSTYLWSSIPAGFSSISSNPIPGVSPIVTTTYILEETTAAGCKKTDNVTITVYPDPTSAITTGPSSICETQSNVVLEATIVNDYDAIAWEVVPANAGNLNIISDTRVTFTPTAFGINSGTVIVRHTLTNKCGITQTPVNFPITIQKQAIANAGISVSTCDINSVQLNGTGSINATTYSWTKPTNITGSFSPANSATPTYTPSAADVANYTGPIPFTLTVSSGSACSVNPPSTVNVTIIKKPVISAGPANTTICEDAIYTIAPSVASVDANTASYVWNTTGDGIFTNGTTLTPTYTPGTQDKIDGTVTISLEARGNFPCAVETAETVITIIKKPVVNYSDDVVCGNINTPIPITGSIQNAGIIQWFTPNGLGSFDDSAIQNPRYTPNVLDMTNNPIIFRLRVYNNSGCNTSEYVEKFIEYTINPEPTVSAGLDTTICEGTTFQFTTASKTNANIVWSALPLTGSFNNSTEVNPRYTPNPSDTSVTLTITGTQPGCSNVTDSMVLTIQKKPQAIADDGLPQIICQGDPFYFNASAPNSSSVLWQIESGGTSGILNNQNTISASYSSGANEAGTVTFSLTAYPLTPGCNNSAPARAITQVTIVPKPKVTFSATTIAQRTICEGLNYVVNSATALHYDRIQWTTSGDGTFITGATTQTPTYQPGTADIASGRVLLTLKAFRLDPCLVDAQDSIEIIITKNPIITSFATSLDICTGVGVPVPLTDVNLDINAQNFDVLTWTSSSNLSAGFLNANPINTVNFNSYTPTADDIANRSVNLTLKAIRNSGCNTFDDLVITLNFIKVPVANAGPDAIICENETYISTATTASALNHTNVIWTSNGSANTITNPTFLTGMIYTPTQADIDRGSVTLTLTAYGASCQPSVTDDIIITFKKLPIINLVPNASICVNINQYPIIGTTITNSYQVGSIRWESSGTGTFTTTADPRNPIFIPSNLDKSSGSVTLTMYVMPESPCTEEQSESFVLTFIPEPVASAGPDLTKCNLPFTITSATATMNTISRLEWTGGTGSFNVNNTINPTYTPSALDADNSPITLTLTAYPIAPCTNPSVSTITVTIEKSPELTVINQAPVCEDATNVTVLGTTVENESSILWTSTTGTIIPNSTILYPIVTPSAQDIINEEMILTVTASPVAPCATPDVKTVRIPIQKKPSVSTGAAQTICEGSVITTNGASSSNVTNLTWSNNGGDGTFTTSNLNTITEYTPGPIEIGNGSVTLTVTADAIAPCLGTVTATVEHLITKNPVITVNPTQVTICETDTYQVPLSQVTVVNPTSIATIQWTTTNTGSLTGSTTFTPIYTPSAADITAGFANLVLTVTPIAPCATPIVKTIRVNITKKATIDATQANYTFCENTPKQLSAVFDHHNPATISWAIVSGSGTLSGIITDRPIFTPDTSSSTVIIEVSVNSNAPCTGVTKERFTLNVIKKPIVTFANTTDIICNTQTSYPLNATTIAATVTNTTANTTYLWTTTGTGTFANNTALVTTYNFSAADLLLNTVTLRLVAQSEALCAMTDFEEIVITIKPAPIVTTAPNETICEGTIFTATATATNENSVLWTTSGTSNGTFTNANTETAQYTPGSNDVNGFTLLFTAYGDPVCSVATATKTVVIQKLPLLDAGVENRNNCSSEPFQLTGVTGQNNGTITWTSNSSSGVNSGTFSNASILNPIYTPSAAEIAAGTPIILTVTSQSIAPCTSTISDFVILNLTPTQVVNAGLNQTICENETVSLIGSASNSSSYNWTTSGTGTFSNINSLTTNYTPSTADILSNTVTLTLHATSNSTCPNASDSTVITIREKPTANAGIAATICEGSNYTLSLGEATATNYTSLVWSATGAGALDVTTIDTLTPTYIPASGQTGTVTLTLTATGYAECTQDAVSVKTITIVPNPFVTVASSKTICEGSTLIITNTDASATNYSNLQWSSSNGLGTFTPNNATATTYTPAIGQTGNVTLSLTASSPNGVCPSSVGVLQLNIIPKPIVEAGTNGTICQTGTYTVTGASVQNASLYSWSVSGPAIIVPGTENSLNPEIDPNDNASGTITVTLTATGTGICPVTVTDNLTIQINPAPTVTAGSDGLLCEGTGSFQLNGNVTNTTNYSWTTTGGGTIQLTANPLAPLYIPSASDYNTSTGVNVITITLNATTTNGCSAASDSMQLTLYAKPKIYAGNDLVSCGNDYSVSLLGANVSNYNSGYSITWTSTGNGTFDYSNGEIRPDYIFGTNDTSSVTLTMSVLPNANCPQVAVTDAMTITINQNPTITTTSNVISMCGETFTLPDLVTVSNSNNLLWTNITGVSGTPGTLTNATTETPTFTPSVNEIANGFVLLKLTANPISGCSLPATITIRVNLQPKAKINLVPSVSTNITACQGEVITINNIASVEDYSTFLWTENGTGSIVPSTLNTLNPEYTPGINETGVVSFTLQATNISPCTGLVSQIVTVTIAPQPSVNAGPDVTICENTAIALNTATTTNSNSIIWLSSENSNGTSSPGYTGGSFSNINIINPIYTPSQDDINLGYVYLTVRAANTLCNSLVTDVIKVTITPQITVAAGSNATICEGSAFTLAGASHTNAVGYTWTSSQNSNGTSIPTYISGSFSSNSILNPVYTPSLDDINLGYVYLTITGTGGNNCPIATSQMKLTIVKQPTVSTTDVPMCMNTPQIILNGNATNYQSLNWSIYSGPGSISTNPLDPLHPTFISGISGLNTVQTTVVRLYAEPIPGCAQSTAVYDDLVITIQPLPSVEAGSDGAVCYVPGLPITPFAITGTTVTNASSQSWSSSGVGIFNTGTTVTYQSFSTICATETLTLTANGIGACSTSTVSDNINLTINCAVPSLGTITSNAPATVCQGTTATYTIPVNTAIQTYTWAAPPGSIIQSGQGTNSITVLFGANSGIVSVTGTNGCGSTIASTPQITVNTLPTGVSITGPQTVCAGATNLVYTASSIPNATTYVWTLPNGSTIITATNTITIAIGVNETSGNISVAGSNSCGLGSSSSTFPITINPKPVLTSTLNPAALCSGTVFNYIPTTATIGSTFSWTRAVQPGISNVAASGIGSISETLINTTNTNVTVAYEITITTPQGCTNSQFISFTLYPAPSLTSNPTPNPICTGSTFNYTPSSSTSGTILWQRNATSGILEAANNNSGLINEVLTNTTNSPITVTYLLTLPATTNGCTNATQITVPVVVNPNNTVSTASSTPILCINTSLTPINHTTTGATGIAIATGLPAGVTASWIANTITISGTPTVSGTFNYTIPLIGGCGTVNANGSITVNPNNTVTSIASNQTLCINSPLTPITHTTTGATGIGTATGLPAGVIASWLANTITISGTPSASGTFNYNIPLTGGCGGAATGTITVIPSNTVTTATTPTLCINTILPSFVHTTTGATGIGTATGLPVGVTASWASNSITISGTPTVSGIFNYSIPLTGGCSTINATGSIIVNPDNTVTSTTSNQTVCINTVLPSITHTTTGATGIGAATSLPPGVTATWAGNIITISGTPSASGIFNYSIPLTGGCNTVFATGTITVNPNNTVTPSSGPQTVCINTILTTITHNTTGATGIGSITGLPTGVTASWSANIITISGAPTALGTFNYSIPLTGGCNTINTTGTIIVNPNNTVSSASSSEILCINTILPSITHTTTGATGIGTATGLPTGVNASWLANTITISGAPTVSGIFNYSIPLTGGCNTLFATGSIIVNPNNTVTPSSGPQTLCINTTLATITHTTTGATGIGTATGLPAGVIASWLANTITISGTPSASGTFNYNIPLTGGCGGAATGTITVIPSNTVTTATTPTLCINTILPSFVHTTTGATGIGTATGLPVGVTASWASNSITISGTPTVSGIFNYSIPLTGGCSTINATGSIIVNPDNTVTSTTSNQTVCINTVLPTITHTTTGATGIGAATSLPPGVTATWAGNIITISGTPTTSDIFNYSIPLTGGCNTVFATGTITVNPVPVVNITNPAPACLPATVDITATTSGSTPGLSYTYWNNSAATIALVNPSTVSISGTYYIKGTNSFGCSTISPVVVTIYPSPTATITGQNSFIVCQNGTQPQITFTASNGTAPYTFTYQVISNGSAGPTLTVTTLGASTSSTISFPTTVSGNHTITLLSVQDSSAALCNSTNITLPNTAFVTVQQVGTIIPINQAVVSQTVCQTTPITPIVFTIGGAATNAFATNLPNGLSGSYASGIFTISGIPLQTGIFNYIVNTSGSTNGCNSTYSGTITVNSNDNILALLPASVNQTVCNNISIQPIVYNLGGGATGGIVTFSPSQPLGITWSILNNVITISGASNTIGTFTYTVQSFGICGQSTATGNITINPSTTIALVSGNPNTTVCIGSSLPPIQYSITPATATMVVTGLPTGITFDPTTGIITGTPTQSGTFNYNISSTTTCGNTLTGTITVNPLQSIGYLSGNTNQVACQNTLIDPINFLVSGGVNTVTVTPPLPTGITYNIVSGILTVSGTPTVATSVAQNYTITTQGSCGSSATYSITFDIRPEATITLTSGSGSINQSVCQSSAITPITFTIGGGATGVIFPNPMPNGVTWSFNAGTGVYTIQGNPLVNGIFNFPITTTGCPKTLFVTISNVNTAVGIVLTSSTGTDNQTLCQPSFSTPIQPIIYNVIGATNIFASGLPPGVTAVFSAGTLIISGTPLVSGVFNYTVTSQPCSIVKAGVIRVSTPISITNERVTNVSCSNINDGTISVDIVGGVSFNGLYAIRWTGPNGFQQNREDITGLAPGTYVLSGTDAIGCPLPTVSYTVLPAQPIIISLQSSTNIDCNGVLGCANFNITGGSGIYTDFTLQYLDPSLQTLVTLPPPANNNYFNICNLRAGVYYLTVEDSNNCSTIPYLFTIYDYSALSIENITMDDELCQNNPGKIRIRVNSLDPNLTFYYNDVLVPFVDLGNTIYELSINTPTTPFGIVKVKNSQNCWKEIRVSTAIISPDFEFTSNDYENYGYFSVNQSIQFTQLFNTSSIPAEYHYIVWDFGDNTPFKVFDNVEDLNLVDIENVFHTYTANGIYEITLTVYNRFGCSRKITKIIKVGTGATIMLPTIFTPNNDGINDYFRPSTIGLKKVAMFIYDKWGNLVYEFSSDVSSLEANWGWNGIEKGKSEPINNDYRYYIIGTTINDINEEKEGRFLLVK